MINSSRQLKDKIKNISGGNNEIAQNLIRNFMMERFLERVSLSKYNRNFVLKGGMLVSFLIGVEFRGTMDIDTTFESLPLNETDTKRIIEEIIAVSIEDQVTFKITKLSRIMTDFEYPGIRIILEAKLDTLTQKIKIDISTDDAITPAAVKYDYHLMFEDRYIPLMTYTTETLLAEKIQTILSRGIATTRMRDFYDIYEIANNTSVQINFPILVQALDETCKKRNTHFNQDKIVQVLDQIEKDTVLSELWNRYQKDNFYVGNLEWKTICPFVCHFITSIKKN